MISKRFRCWVIAWSLLASACGSELDRDGDGWLTPADCNDNNSQINPLADEIPYDGIDQDCDAKDLTDWDRDGYDDMEEVEGGTDCEDRDPTIHPGAREIPYDGIDQDCDGLEDDGDADGDGYPGVTVGGDDCCDLGTEDSLGCSLSLAAGIHPGAAEISYDGVDQDCNGRDYGGGAIEGDADGDGFVSDQLPDGIDCDDTDRDIFPGAPERCNHRDDDCDAQTDEGLIDADRDTSPACLDCDDFDSRRKPGNPEIPYDGIDQDCDGLADDSDVDRDGYLGTAAGGDDCNDNDPNIQPGATEVCNRLDDNCQNGVDEGFVDADLDGWCEGLDCNDLDPGVNPNTPEFIGDVVDNDCDGLTDEWDNDGDGFADVAAGGNDCNDGNPGIYPGANETPYDGVDQDCDGLADDTDVDGDGHLGLPAGGDDCNDSNPEIYPDHEESCNDPADNNCNGMINEGCGPGSGEEVKVVEGAFTMGRTNQETVFNPDQQPQHQPFLDLFYIDKYEVTVSQYRRCVLARVCSSANIGIPSISDDHYWENQGRGIHPAINVSWQQALTYCQWVGKDLPTEAQWEKAARGAGNSDWDYPWGDIETQPGPDGAPTRVPVSCELANHRHLCTLLDCVGDTEIVSIHEQGKSRFMLFNLAGNVSEWVKDWYDPGYYSVSSDRNPTGPGFGAQRVIRGGSFQQIDYYLEVTCRQSAPPDSRSLDRGFRCARVP